MAGTFENWQTAIEPLARQHTVVAPDLPGHGTSAPSGGDYSIGALAAELRDLLASPPRRFSPVFAANAGKTGKPGPTRPAPCDARSRMPSAQVGTR